MERLPLRESAALALSLLAACTPGSCEGAGDRLPASERQPVTDESPAPVRAARDDLPLATPATEVTLRRGAIRVHNHALVGTWPAEALEAARGAGPEGAMDWPRLDTTLEAPTADGSRFPSLEAVLVRARRAEASATGSGSGAGVYNFRVDADVPMVDLQRVMFSASMAGYGAPRLLFDADGEERMMPWPRAPNDARLTEAQIAELLAAAGQPVEPAPSAPTTPPAPPGARLELDDERARAYVGDRLQAPGCERDAAEGTQMTFDGDAPVDALVRCLARLATRVEGRRLVLRADGELPFGRVAPLLQHAAADFEQVSVPVD
ncbi:MAG: hypothetical protein SangKO_037740 [Sandaracinaceae bacterium]